MKKTILTILLATSIQSYASDSSEATFDLCFATMEKVFISNAMPCGSLFCPTGWTQYKATIEGVRFVKDENNVLRYSTDIFTLTDDSKKSVRNELNDALHSVQESGICKYLDKRVKLVRN